MFTCKMCLKPKHDSEESSAHLKMCRSCWGDVLYYKRHVGQPDLNPDQQDKMQELEFIFKRNKLNGAYVPKYFGSEKLTCSCKWCGNRFIISTVVSQCADCRKMDQSYRSLLYRYRNTGRSSKRLTDLEIYYTKQHAAGYKVPKVFLEDSTIKRA